MPDTNANASIAIGTLLVAAACSLSNQPAATSECLAGVEPYVRRLSSGAIVNMPFTGRIVSREADGKLVPRPGVKFQREQPWHPDPAKRVITEALTTDRRGWFAYRLSPAFGEREICEDGRLRTVSTVVKIVFLITAPGCAQTRIAVDDTWQERDIELECTR